MDPTARRRAPQKHIYVSLFAWKWTYA